MYWKCEKHENCKGRALSTGLKPPLKHSKPHSHYLLPERTEVLKLYEDMKENAIKSNDRPRTIIRDEQAGASEEAITLISKSDAMRQMITRTRSKKARYGLNAKSIAGIQIPDNLKRTYKDDLFYYDDSRSSDKNRVLLFTTKANLKLLEENHDWYIDGTFDVSPSYFNKFIQFI